MRLITTIYGERVPTGWFALEAPMRELRRRLAEPGKICFLTNEPKGSEPRFGITVGHFQNGARPELMMFLPAEKELLIKALQIAVAAMNEQPPPNALKLALKGSMNANIFKLMVPKRQQLVATPPILSRYYKQTEFPLLQVTIPDASGRYCDEPGYDYSDVRMGPVVFG